MSHLSEKITNAKSAQVLGRYPMENDSFLAHMEENNYLDELEEAGWFNEQTIAS